MAQYDPISPLRKDLYRIFKNQRVVRAIEQIFDLLPSDILQIIEYINTSKINQVSVSSDITADIGNYLLLVDATAGNVTVKLPDATAATYIYDAPASIGVEKVDTSNNIVTIKPLIGSQTISGEASQSLIVYGEILNFTPDGSNWVLSS